jgi:hypothetical protein
MKVGNNRTQQAFRHLDDFKRKGFEKKSPKPTLPCRCYDLQTLGDAL